MKTCESNDNNDTQELLNETIITLRIPKKYYKTAYTLAHIFGHKSLDDYVSDIVIQNVEMEIRGVGSIILDDSIETKKLLGEGLNH
jgi:hypothetical protein